MRVFIIIAMLFAFIPPVMAEEGVPMTEHKHETISEKSAHTMADQSDSKKSVHICPMHPEITGEAGDRCSICGMNLVAQEGNDSMSGHKHEHDTHPMESAKEKADKADSKESVYICPMHPHITGEEGDNCPICGMNLTPKEAESAPADDGHSHGDNVEGSIHIDPSYTQTLGVKITTVRHEEFGEGIRAFGRITTNMRNEREIAIQEEGWVKTLKTSAVGDVVKKGDLLFSIYSPDLMAAQSDYMIGRRTGYRIGNPEQRLRLKGMDNKAIAILKKKGRMMERTPFHAPIDGTITALNAREGSHVSKGEVLLTIQDFSEVWINADVPIRDLQFLEEKMPAKIKLPETGEEYETVIDYIHPVNDPKSRTAMVRLILENPDGKLKPDTYVDVVFQANAESRLVVPSDAVLYGSMGTYVIEDVKNGNFRPVMVKTGATSYGLTEIKSGLSNGQRIVASGQFMIDAESNLRGGMAAMDHDMEGKQVHVH